MKSEILTYINTNTNRDRLDTVNTKEVATAMYIGMDKAFRILNDLAKEGLLLKMDPIGSNLTMCDWVRVSDETEAPKYTKTLAECIAGHKARKAAQRESRGC